MSINQHLHSVFNAVVLHVSGTAVAYRPRDGPFANVNILGFSFIPVRFPPKAVHVHNWGK